MNPPSPPLSMEQRWLHNREQVALDRLIAQPKEYWTTGVDANGINPAELFKATAPHRRLRLADLVFEHDVDLRLYRNFSEVIFSRCEFRGSVDGSGACFAGNVVFMGCRFRQSLTLNEAEFKRGLCVIGCLLEVPDYNGPPKRAELHEAPSKARSAWWPGLRVNGLLRLDRTTFGGSLNLAEARINGPLFMRGVEVGAGRPRGRLHLRQIRVDGDIDLSPHVPDREHSRKASTIVYGSVVLGAATVNGRVDLRGIEITGRLHLPLAHIANNLDARAWLHSNDDNPANFVPTIIRGSGHRGVAVRMADAVIDHAVMLDGIEIHGQFNAKNARIGGDFSLRPFRDKKTSRSVIERSRIENPPEGDPMPEDRSEGFRLRGSHIGGDLEIENADVHGEISLENVVVGGNLCVRGIVQKQLERDKQPDRVGLKLDMANVGRSIDLRASRFANRIRGHGLHVKGDMRFGDLDCPPPIAGESPNDRESPAGAQPPSPGRYEKAIDLSNAEISGALFFCSGIYDGCVTATGIRIGHECSFSGGLFRQNVIFDDTVVDGNLWLGQSTKPDNGSQRDGTYFGEVLSLQRSRIQGNVLFHELTIGHAPDEKILEEWQAAAKRAQKPTPIHESEDKWLQSLHLKPHREVVLPAKNENNPEPVLDLRLAKIGGAWLHSDHRASAEHGSPPAVRDPHHCGVICGMIHAANLSIEGDFHLTGFRICGDLYADGMSVGGDFCLDYSTLERNLNVSGAKIEGRAFTRQHLPRVTTPADRLKEAWVSPNVRGHIVLHRAEIQDLALVFDVRDENDRNLLPSGVELKHAVAATLTIRGRLPFPEKPYFEMEGLRFDEIDTAGLEILRLPSREPREYPTRSGSLRRRLYFWAFPTVDLCLLLSAVFVICPLLAEAWFSPWQLIPLGIFAISLAARGKLDLRLDNAITPRCEVLFLRLMPALDGGLYSRMEAWLRARNRHEDADLVYFERRLLEVESGVIGWIWHRTLATGWGFLCASGRIFRAAPQGTELDLWDHGVACCHAVPRLVRRLLKRDTPPDDRKRLSLINQSFLRNRLLATSVGRRAFDHPSVIIETAQNSGDAQAGDWKQWERQNRGEMFEELVTRILRTPKRLAEWFLLVFLGDGIRVGPVVIIYLTLFCFSWWRVYSHPDSVERPSTFISPMEPVAHDGNHAETTHQPIQWREQMGNAEQLHWGIADSLWITANAQIPLVNLTAREKWRPSSERVEVFDHWSRWVRRKSHRATAWLDAPGHEWVCVPGYDTWSSVVQVFGWVTVPIILGAFTGLLRRRPLEAESSEE